MSVSYSGAGNDASAVSQETSAQTPVQHHPDLQALVDNQQRTISLLVSEKAALAASLQRLEEDENSS